MTTTSDSDSDDDDDLPISQMAARRKSKRNAKVPPKKAPKKKKQQPKKEKNFRAGSRRSRRLRGTSDDDEEEKEQDNDVVVEDKKKLEKKKAPAKGKSKTKPPAAAQDAVFSPRKTRAQRKQAKVAKPTEESETPDVKNDSIEDKQQVVDESLKVEPDKNVKASLSESDEAKESSVSTADTKNEKSKDSLKVEAIDAKEEAKEDSSSPDAPKNDVPSSDTVVQVEEQKTNDPSDDAAMDALDQKDVEEKETVDANETAEGQSAAVGPAVEEQDVNKDDDAVDNVDESKEDSAKDLKMDMEEQQKEASLKQDFDKGEEDVSAMAVDVPSVEKESIEEVAQQEKDASSTKINDTSDVAKTKDDPSGNQIPIDNTADDSKSGVENDTMDSSLSVTKDVDDKAPGAQAGTAEAKEESEIEPMETEVPSGQSEQQGGDGSATADKEKSTPGKGAASKMDKESDSHKVSEQAKVETNDESRAQEPTAAETGQEMANERDDTALTGDEPTKEISQGPPPAIANSEKDSDAMLVDESSTTANTGEATPRVVEPKASPEEAGALESQVCQQGEESGTAIADGASPLDLLAKVAVKDESKGAREVAKPPDSEPTQGPTAKSLALELLANVADNDADTSVTNESKDTKPVATQEIIEVVMTTPVDPSKDPTEQVADSNDVDVSVADESKDSKEVAPAASPAAADIDDEPMKDVSAVSVLKDVTEKVLDKDAIVPVDESSQTVEDASQPTISETQEKTNDLNESRTKVSTTEGGDTTEPMEVQPVEPQVEHKDQAVVAEAKSSSPDPDRAPVQGDVEEVEAKAPVESNKVDLPVATATDTRRTSEHGLGAHLEREQQMEKVVMASETQKKDEVVPKVHDPTVPAEPNVSASETIDAVLAGVTTITHPPRVGVCEPPEGGTAPPGATENERGFHNLEQDGASAESAKSTDVAPEKTSASDAPGSNATAIPAELGTMLGSPIEATGVAKKPEDANETGTPATPSSTTPGSKDLSGAVSDPASQAVVKKESLGGSVGRDHGESFTSGEKEMSAVPMDIDAIVEGEPDESGPTLGAAEKQAEEVGHTVEQQAQAPTGNERESCRVEKVKAVKKTVPVTFKLPTEEETAALLDAFPGMTERRKPSESRPRKRPRKNLSIRLSSVPSSKGENDQPEPNESVTEVAVTTGPLPGLPDALNDFVSVGGASLNYDHEFEDSLSFFSETHEDQDPTFIEFQHEKENNRLKDELANLKAEYDAGVSKINAIIASQMNEKQANADNNIQKLRVKQSAEEQKDLQRLQEAYGQKMKSNDSKIDHGIKLMTNRQSQEMKNALLQHRQQAQQRGIPEQMVATEWGPISERLQAKHQQALKEFNAKGEEVKKRYEAEYQREKEKYMAHHEKRRNDLQENMKKVIAHIRTTFHQQHQRYLKAHALRVRKRRSEIMALLEESTQEPCPTAVKAGKEDTELALRSPSPVALGGESVDESVISVSVGAATRSRHRKGILGAIRKQLSVEIHNEGLWISVIAEKGDDSKKDAKKPSTDNDGKEVFVPWGIKARDVLRSIVCGEIPLGYGTDRFDFGDAVAVQGGHIRCVVVDLRVSEETASAQRAAGMKQQEADTLKALQDNAEKLGRQAAETEAHANKAAIEEKEMSDLHEKALKDVEKAKNMLQQLRNKFKNLLGPGDVPLSTLNANDQQKLTSAMGKYSANVEGSEARAKAIEKALYEKKVRAQKMMAAVRQTNKAASAAATSLKKRKAQAAESKSSRNRGRLSETMESDRASTRVADVIGGLQKAAEGRRKQLDKKRSSSASSTYVQSLPGLPNALKKSLWHKMHRRRQQIVLRPTMDFVLSDMKEKVEEDAFYSKGRSSSTQDAAVRAEQLFLLAAFPEQGSTPLPSTPPSDSHASWAEPGWQINLDVPQDEPRGSRSLLPRVPVSSVMQNSHAEFCSAPGRQASSLIKSTHIQALNTPLSAVVQAISLAEMTPVAKERALSDNDPFNVPVAAMKAGSEFALRSPSKSASQSRRKTTPKEDKPSLSSPSPVPLPKPATAIKPKPAAKAPSPTPVPAPPKRSSSTSSQKTSTMAKSDKPTKPKRSRSKSGTGASPCKASKKNVDATAAASAAAAADVASQARTYIQQQQQAAANALYGQQRAASVGQQAAQYSPSYMKQVAASQANLQGLPPAMAAQQQPLLPQPPYGSPQQQFQQRQLAQMRMMQQQQQQQQQQQGRGFPQQQPNMQFFPAAMQAAAARQQQSYGSQQAMAPMPGQQQPPRRRTSSGDERNDPIFMLPDVPPPPPPQPPQG